MLALLIFSYANGLFSSHRIERATYRDIGMRVVAANLHPDHDTIATFRRTNRTAILCQHCAVDGRYHRPSGDGACRHRLRQRKSCR
ncbi:transposase [Acetobacter aceti]|uniref:transposase n=1 Tax=Acetobacter aceti TaxID=435 RepID=UPI0038CFA8C8